MQLLYVVLIFKKGGQMNFIRVISFLLVTSFLYIGCGSSGSNNGGIVQTTTSNDEVMQLSGLVLFVTERKHVGNFRDDPTLTGQNAIEKADFFCNTDPGKPNNSQYKALLVDGIFRDAATKLDWVLQPDTTYYRPFDNKPIDTTDSEGIFNVHWEDMDNNISDLDNTGPDSYLYPVWTGLTKDFTSYDSENTCNGWSVDDNSRGIHGKSSRYNWTAFNCGTMNCSAPLYLYCVEQP